MGAWALFLMLVKRTLTTPQDAQDISLRWLADGFWIYDGPAPTGALVWRIDFADEATAARVVTALLPTWGIGNIRQTGTRVVLAKATDAQSLDWAFAP
jgi:hypothetical protein